MRNMPVRCRNFDLSMVCNRKAGGIEKLSDIRYVGPFLRKNEWLGLCNVGTCLSCLI